MRTPRDPSFATVSWVIQWRREPQDAQVGLKLVSSVFWLLAFQRQTLSIICSLASLRMLPTLGCDCVWWVTDMEHVWWVWLTFVVAHHLSCCPACSCLRSRQGEESGYRVWAPRFWCVSSGSCSSVHFLRKTAAQTGDIRSIKWHKEIPGVACFGSSFKLTKMYLDST